MQVPSQWNHLYERFKMFFPCYADEVVYWYPEGPNQILCVMRDRGKVIYDDNTQSAFCMQYRDDIDNEETYARDFGNRLSNRMNDRGISQGMLSKMTGISTRMLSNYMHGKSMPGQYNIILIARALRCTPNELLYSYEDLTVPMEE